MKKTVKLDIARLICSLNGEGGEGVLNQIEHSYRHFAVSGEGKGDMSLNFQVTPFFGEGKNPKISFDSERNSLQMETDKFNLWFNCQLNEGKAVISSDNPLLSLGTILRNIYTWHLMNGDGIVFHASGLIKDGSAYIFIGPSKSGKSTVSRLSSHLTLINDDIIFLREGKDGFRIFTTPPWSCQIKVLEANISVPLQALFLLKKDKRNFLEKLSHKEALSLLMTSPYLPLSTANLERLISRFQRLIAQTPTYKLHFLPQVSFWQCIKNELSH